VKVFDTDPSVLVTLTVSVVVPDVGVLFGVALNAIDVALWEKLVTVPSETPPSVIVMPLAVALKPVPVTVKVVLVLCTIELGESAVTVGTTPIANETVAPSTGLVSVIVVDLVFGAFRVKLRCVALVYVTAVTLAPLVAVAVMPLTKFVPTSAMVV
jgi:hypothetical protein